MGYLDYAGLQYLWGKLKEKFAPKSHTHDDRYYTEAEMDGKLNSKVNNTRDGANSLINALDSGTAAPTDPDYIITQWVGGGTSNTTWVRRPASSFWAYIKGKADGVYQPKGSYAASNHSHTKDQVGLGNVDNTADANKSVKYATNAGSANSLSGLSSRSSQSWGVQTGTFIHGEGDTTGGDFAFRRDCPNAGQISMVLDGRFYQNEGQYRVLDTSDEANLNVRSANFAKETYINRYKTVNLTDLDQNTWYPVTGTYIPYRGLRRFKCSVQLDSGSKPSWSAHSAGFTAVVDILEESFGWGTTSMQGMVLVNDQRFIADESKPPVGYGQLGNSSIPVWWLRGGGTYFLAADYDCTWTIRKSKFEKNGQSVEPRTTYPGVNVNRSTITANLNGNATTADVANAVDWSKVQNKPSSYAPASHTHDDRYYTESEVNTKLANYQPKGNYAAASHTHNYAGSGTAGGSANSAIKLDSSAGSATRPVYFSGGKPVAIGYTIAKSVPADAKFTDTNTWRGIQNNLTSDSTDQSLSAAQGKALKTLVDGKAPASHKHTKSQITDFPTSMPASDVSAWAKAATKPSYTKAEVGLSNVDNTADKNKNVKFATSAGSATNAQCLNNDSQYMRFHWNGQSGQPSWLWGGSDASNMYVYNPSNFSVNYANSAGTTLDVPYTITYEGTYTGTGEYTGSASLPIRHTLSKSYDLVYFIKNLKGRYTPGLINLFSQGNYGKQYVAMNMLPTTFTLITDLSPNIITMYNGGSNTSTSGQWANRNYIRRNGNSIEFYSTYSSNNADYFFNDKYTSYYIFGFNLNHSLFHYDV